MKWINYLRTGFRYLWKNRLFTALNIVGLAVGITACWVLMSIVRYESSYESGIPKKHEIYRLITGHVWDGEESMNGGISSGIYLGIRESLPSVKATVPVYGQRALVSRADQGENPPVELDEPKGIVATDSAYFDLLPYTWLAGNAQTALIHPESVVLAASRARIYFPDLDIQDIVGRTIVYDNYGGESDRRTVSAIYADLDFPSEFAAQEIIPLKLTDRQLNDWTNTSGEDKLYIAPHQGHTAASVLEQINTLIREKREAWAVENGITREDNRWFELIPLTEMHFETRIEEWEVHKVSKNLLYGLSGTALFLLMLACINYINLSTAQIPQRGKEIGIRKTLGSSKGNLIAQVFVETAAVVLCAALLSVPLTKVGFTAFANIIPEGAPAFQYHASTLLLMGMVLLATVFLSALYPSFQIARINPLASIKNGLASRDGKGQLTLRKGLIVFQYTIAQCFIIGAIIVGQQLKYTLDKDLGFDKDAVVVTEVPWKLFSDKAYEGKEKVLADEVRKIAGVRDVVTGNMPLEGGYSSSPYEYTPEDGGEPVRRQMVGKMADNNYIPFYDMQLLAGRNLVQSDTVRELVINESAVQAFGIASPEQAVGKMLKNFNNTYSIVGVVKDFHLKDFYNNIEPVAITTSNQPTGHVHIKLGENPREWQKTIAAVKEAWATVYPVEEFDYAFYDQRIAGLYEKEQSLSKLINVATLISIFIGCLGLFGLATLMAYQRTKEIGIRKVLGASIGSITALLSKDFVKLVCLAIVIASPLAWWAMNKWLEDFVYRIEVNWWIFVLSGFIALVIAVLTVSWQAIRAATANPVDSLRDE